MKRIIFLACLCMLLASCDVTYRGQIGSRSNPYYRTYNRGSSGHNHSPARVYRK